jgi:transposase, IS30 family
VSTYRQLSLDERYQIATRLRLKQSVPEIARALERHPSTIYREVARNGGPYSHAFADAGPQPPNGKYAPESAHRRAAQRRVEKGASQRKIQGELKTLVESKLRLSWSPEQICGRLLVECGIRLSHETVYQHILRDSKQLGFYRYCLRFGGYKHHRFKKSKMGARTKLRKHWIEDRPAAANDRSELGHWERDILLGKRGGSALLTLEDRKSRYVRLRRVSSLEVASVAPATEQALKGLTVKTITNDNGVEFQRDDLLERRIGVPIYFCNPSSPWERGSIENTNGLIRQYFAKGYDFDAMPSWATTAVEETLNHRPRKVLGYKTPHEALNRISMRIMKDPAMHFGLEFSRVK